METFQSSGISKVGQIRLHAYPGQSLSRISKGIWFNCLNQLIAYISFIDEKAYLISKSNPEELFSTSLIFLLNKICKYPYPRTNNEPILVYLMIGGGT